MWEITLLGKISDFVFFQQLKDNLKNQFDNNIVVVITYNENLICSIATSENKYIKQLKIAIFETIIKIAKCEYLRENLTIWGLDKTLNSFVISSLVLIDLDDEVNFAKDTTKLTKVVFIRSFVYFKLFRLLIVWKKLVVYLNLHFSDNMQEGLYLEFLKFVAENSNSKLDIMYIEQNQDETILLDSYHKKISAISKRDEIGIIVNLLLYSPKKVIINCFDSLSRKVSSLISYIFSDRVCVLL